MPCLGFMAKERKMKSQIAFRPLLAANVKILVAAFFGVIFTGAALYAGDGKIPVHQAGTLSSSGYYYLTQDITSGSGIQVGADNVTLDLNGHLLVSTGYGVYSPGHTNVRVTNGSISASNSGINISTLPAGAFVQVDHVRIISAVNYGIVVVGPSTGMKAQAIIEANTIVTVNPGNGIELDYLTGSRIQGNTVTSIFKSSGNGIGISIISSLNSLVCDNVCGGSGSYGIYLSSCTGFQVARNTCANDAHGILASSCNGCSFTWNTLSSNSSYGLYISLGSNNIYDNNQALNNISGGFLVSSSSGTIGGAGNTSTP